MKLLVIDIQNGLLEDGLYNKENFLKKVSKLISTARKNNIEVIYVMHDEGKGSGFSIGDHAFEIGKRVKPMENEKVYIKTINSAFGNKEFEAYLKESNDKDLMIVGLQTEYCIDATIKSAFERGYKVYIPNGCNSTFDTPYLDAKNLVKYYYEWIWYDRFGKCITYKDAVSLLENK